MRAKWAALAMIGLALGGCALWRHKPEPAVPKGADPLIACPKDNPCSKIANRRQYFSQHDNRYYYFDRATGRYYWENGQPRF
jgi:hypothetical protein